MLSAVDDVADPRVTDALHVELAARPVTAYHQMIVVETTCPAVHYPQLVRTTNHCTVVVIFHYFYISFSKPALNQVFD